MKQIPLYGQHGVNRFALVDDIDYEAMSQYRWNFHPSGYASSSTGGRKARKHLYMHRLILDPPPGMETDHVNRDGLDNRRCNLRVATSRENKVNRNTVSKWGYRGVVRHVRGGRKPWQARLMHNRRRYSLGYYLTVEEAARAFNEGALRIQGPFAKLNVLL